ncbi:MAG: DUF3631 domain-containing protein [Solirubrobacterales bacterium]
MDESVTTQGSAARSDQPPEVQARAEELLAEMPEDGREQPDRISAAVQRARWEIASPADLLDGIADVVRRFVVLSDEQRDVVALWVLHSHAIEAADSTPYLAITSAEKQSGKSRLLEVLATLCPRPIEAINISEAALFRVVSSRDGSATLLFDEIDTIWGPKARDKEDLRGLINAGWRRGSEVPRCVGPNHDVKLFPVFSAKALAGIGELPDTIADRCIPIRMRRRAPGEVVERGRYRSIVAACTPLREAAEVWAEMNVADLSEAEPALPDELSDRAQDGAEPLLAIANAVGATWPGRARKALVSLYGGAGTESESYGVQLLVAIREALGDQDRITTADLLAALKADPEAPWAGWGRGNDGMTPRHLANLLRPFGIRSRSVRLSEGGTAKGYLAEQFEDAWRRYLATPNGTSGTSALSSGKRGDSSRHKPPSVPDSKSASNPHTNADVAGVPDSNDDGGDKGQAGGLVEQTLREFGGADE